MKLSTRSRYGMRAALDLAKSYGEGPVQIKSIAKAEDISTKYLEQLISILKSAGIVRSIRGPRGGYMLAKAPSDITLLEIFRVLEGPFVPVECLSNPSTCGRCPECLTRIVWAEVQQAIEGVLGGTTLEGLLEKSRGGSTSDYQI